MNEKQTKLIIAAIIIIIVIILILLISISKLKEIGSSEEVMDNKNVYLEVKEEADLIVSQSLYFTVKDNILQKYLTAVEDGDSTAVCNMLSIKYKDTNGINEKNVIEKSSVYKIPKAFPKHIYKKELEGFTVFYIDTIIQNNEVTSNMSLKRTAFEEYFKVIMDDENSSFSIEKIDENTYNTGLKIKENQVENITQNDNNIVEYAVVSEDVLVAEYMENYANILENDIKRAYDMLDDDYRNAKFKEYKTFEDFAKSDIKNGIKITKYSKEYVDDGKVKYVCQSEYGITITFTETSVMEYTVQLDDYTIESNEYIEKYKKAKNQQKGILNIGRFFEMLNMQDYSSAYNLLDENFRETYFKTQADFETFVKTYMFKYNNVTYKTYSDQISNLLIYGITLNDSTGENEKEVNCNIIMKLLENTNFVMSFEIVQ